MKVDVLSIEGKVVGQTDLDDSVFGILPNMSVLHEAIVSYLSNQRRGTKSTLTRSEVSGGGCKPWRQKGTGHARQGSIRAPQWTHGGVVFAPKPRDFRKNLMKKVRRIAIRSALSLKAKEQNLMVLDELSMDKYSTKYVLNVLSNINAPKSLVVMPESNKFVVKSGRNIPGVLISSVNTLNSYDIFYHKKLVICKSAVEKINEIFKDSSKAQKVVA